MEIKVYNSYEEASNAAAEIIAKQITKKPDSVIGLPTGSTPEGMYAALAKMHKESGLDFSKITTFNLDEYLGITPDDPQSYRYFMNKNLFSHINAKAENLHILNGMATDPEKECSDYEKAIGDCGGIDVQVLGIGENGHIGFNEPSDELESNTHIAVLTESTVKANSRFFEDVSQVPKKALTMGIGSIVKAKKILMIATGANKHKALSQIFEGKITTSNPATFLNLHSDVTIICDTKAYKGE